MPLVVLGCVHLWTPLMWDHRQVTQPIATIIAACIAVIAASIGLLGVIQNNRHQSKLDDRKAARELTEVRRLEKSDLFVNVIAQVDEIAMGYYLALEDDRDGDESFHRVDQELPKLRLTAIRLELLGYTAEAAAVRQYLDLMVNAATGNANPTAGKINDQRDAIVLALGDAFTTLKAGG